MLKSALYGAAFALLLTGAAVAQQPASPAQAAPTPSIGPAATAATTPDDCLKSAFELAQKAEAKKLSTTDLDALEEMLTKLEDHCDAKRYTEAQAMVGQISTMIDQTPAGAGATMTQ